jgi:predicted membrane-bound dolichyl-phosphate-mannose-protein mannosyltransferase
MSEQILIQQLPEPIVVFMKTVAVRFSNALTLEAKTVELKQKRAITPEYQKRKEIRQQMRALTDNTPLSEYRKLAKEVGRLTRALNKNFKSEKAEIQEIKDTIKTLDIQIVKDLATEPIKSVVSQ